MITFKKRYLNYMFKQVLLGIFSLSILSGCGSSGGDGGGGNNPIPFPATSSAVVGYVEMFKQRYNLEVNYSIRFDDEEETGGSSGGKTTVGVCRIWQSGYRDILINRDWWLERSQITRNLVSPDMSTGEYNYDFTTLHERENGVLKIQSVNVGDQADSNLVSVEGDLDLDSASCNSGTQSCTVTVFLNHSESLTPNSYSGVVHFGTKKINVAFTIISSPSTMSAGEVNRKVLIFHEIGHCSLGRVHSCVTEAQNNSAAQNCTSGQYVEASYSSNAPATIMYPVINPSAQFYYNGSNSYYDQELIDNAVSIYQASSYSAQAALSEEAPYSPLVAPAQPQAADLEADEHFHEDFGSCVKLMD